MSPCTLHPITVVTPSSNTLLHPTPLHLHFNPSSPVEHHTPAYSSKHTCTSKLAGHSDRLDSSVPQYQTWAKIGLLSPTILDLHKTRGFHRRVHLHQPWGRSALQDRQPRPYTGTQGHAGRRQIKSHKGNKWGDKKKHLQVNK